MTDERDTAGNLLPDGQRLTRFGHRQSCLSQFVHPGCRSFGVRHKLQRQRQSCHPFK